MIGSNVFGYTLQVAWVGHYPKGPYSKDKGSKHPFSMTCPVLNWAHHSCNLQKDDIFAIM